LQKLKAVFKHIDEFLHQVPKEIENNVVAGEPGHRQLPRRESALKATKQVKKMM
jgi:hypothetical protein